MPNLFFQLTLFLRSQVQHERRLQARRRRFKRRWVELVRPGPHMRPLDGVRMIGIAGSASPDEVFRLIVRFMAVQMPHHQLLTRPAEQAELRVFRALLHRSVALRSVCEILSEAGIEANRYQGHLRAA